MSNCNNGIHELVHINAIHPDKKNYYNINSLKMSLKD
jgi:hypothetical protein